MRPAHRTSRRFSYETDPLECPKCEKAAVRDDFERLLAQPAATVRDGDHVLIMSNGSFGGIHDKLLAKLALR